MTRFHRRGHWRTSKYGVRHWVSDSDVVRDDWARYSRSRSYRFATTRLDELRARWGFTTAFVNPNATCPVCGADVFFYQNEHGSRVFFDELGPPWPKHPCTDAHISGSALYSPPSVRDDDECFDIASYRGTVLYDSEEDFRRTYKKPPSKLFVVAKKARSADGVLFVLRRIGHQKDLKFCLSVCNVRSLVEGSIVTLGKNHLLYFDTTRMTDRSVDVRRIRSAKDFVSSWVDAKR